MSPTTLVQGLCEYRHPLSHSVRAPVFLFSYLWKDMLLWKTWMAAYIIKCQRALCLTGTLSTFHLGAWHVAVQLSLSWRGKRLRYDCCHSIPRCPSPSCDWSSTFTHPPTRRLLSLHHVYTSPAPGLAGRRNALSHPWRESVASVHIPMAGVRECLCACTWVYCAALCVYCSRTQRDSLSQWRAPV